MDWLTQEAVAAAERIRAKRPKTKSLGLPNQETRGIPAADGRRVLHTQPWQPSKRKRGSVCITYNVNRPGEVSVFHKGQAPTHQTQERKLPEVVRAGLTNNIGEDFS